MVRALSMATSAEYCATEQSIVVGQILFGLGTTTSVTAKTRPPSQTSSGAVTAVGIPKAANAVSLTEVRRLSGLSWDQLARLLKVSRRTLHFWASGKPMARTNEEHLLRVLGVLRLLDPSSSESNRSALFSSVQDEVSAIDLLAARDYERAASVAVRLSAMARAAKAPRSTEVLAGALQERVHHDAGPSRPVRSSRSERRR